MPEVHVAYETHGATEGPCVVFLHDLLTSHRAFGTPSSRQPQTDGWAEGLVGTCLEPTQWRLVSTGLLGSCFGSTSPLSLASSERPYGPNFPSITVDDMARATAGALRTLGIQRAQVVLGVGLGAMVALRLASLFTPLVGSVIALGGAHVLPEGLRGLLGLVPQLLRSDPTFNNGQYPSLDPPVRAMSKIAREFLQRTQSRRSRLGLEDIEARASALASTFDANCFHQLCSAYAGCNLSEHLPQVAAPVLLVAGSDDALAPPSKVRDTYHLLSSANARHFYELPDVSHDEIARSFERLRGPIVEFLDHT